MTSSNAPAISAPDQVKDQPASKPTKHYRKTDPLLSPAYKKFAQVFAATNNASEAVRQAFPQLNLTPLSVRDKGRVLLTNTHVLAEIEEQKSAMQAVAGRAIHKLNSLVDSEKQGIALDASKFVVQQVHGKPKSQTEQRSAHVHVIYNLGGDKAPPVPKEVLDQLESTEVDTNTQ